MLTEKKTQLKTIPLYYYYTSAKKDSLFLFLSIKLLKKLQTIFYEIKQHARQMYHLVVSRARVQAFQSFVISLSLMTTNLNNSHNHHILRHLGIITRNRYVARKLQPLFVNLLPFWQPLNGTISIVI